MKKFIVVVKSNCKFNENYPYSRCIVPVLNHRAFLRGLATLIPPTTSQVLRHRWCTHSLRHRWWRHSLRHRCCSLTTSQVLRHSLRHRCCVTRAMSAAPIAPPPPPPTGPGHYFMPHAGFEPWTTTQKSATTPTAGSTPTKRFYTNNDGSEPTMT